MSCVAPQGQHDLTARPVDRKAERSQDQDRAVEQASGVIVTLATGLLSAFGNAREPKP